MISKIDVASTLDHFTKNVHSWQLTVCNGVVDSTCSMLCRKKDRPHYITRFCSIIHTVSQNMSGNTLEYMQNLELPWYFQLAYTIVLACTIYTSSLYNICSYNNTFTLYNTFRYTDSIAPCLRMAIGYLWVTLAMRICRHRYVLTSCSSLLHLTIKIWEYYLI